MNETLPALQQLKAEGLVRHIGITGLPLKIYKYVLDRCGPGLPACAGCVLWFLQVDCSCRAPVNLFCSALGRTCPIHADWNGFPTFGHVLVCRVSAGTVDTVLSYCHYTLNDKTLET